MLSKLGRTQQGFREGERLHATSHGHIPWRLEVDEAGDNVVTEGEGERPGEERETRRSSTKRERKNKARQDRNELRHKSLFP